MLNNKTLYIVTLFFLIISFYSSYSYFSNNKSLSFKSPLSNNNNTISSLEQSNTESSEPKTEECPLNGQLYSKSQKEIWEKRRPLGIMVENHKEARPQSGLSSADIIYEAVAEGGITRFLSVFYCQDAKLIGPVRSARIYFIKLLQEYGNYPLYAHVGGANTDGPADALGEVEELGWAQFNDLNQFSVPFPNFWRDYDRLPNRDTEHTVYTSSAKLWDYAKLKRLLTNVDKKGKEWDATFIKWKFANDEKTEGRGADGSKISFSFWKTFANEYLVNWTYDKKQNSYKRENGGSAHLDKNTGKQLKAKNVIVIFADESPANDGYPGGHLLYDVIGKGTALVFQNGQVIEANWSKKSENSRLTFTDERGENIALVRGQIFVEILPIGNKVTY